MNFRTISRELNDIFEGSLDNNKRFKIEAYRAVRAVFHAIIDALRRGETVWIDGFGMFEVRTRKGYFQMAPILVNNKRTSKTKRKWYRPRKYVVFKQSRALKRLMNEGTENVES